ncbi:DUF6783 domain-containing protein [Robinsoniella peoriensis]
MWGQNQYGFCSHFFYYCGRRVRRVSSQVHLAAAARGKYTAKWGVQMAGMNFKTRYRAAFINNYLKYEKNKPNVKYLK